MNAAGRLALYLGALAVVFVASFAVAGAVVPDGFVESWLDDDPGHHGSEGHGSQGRGR